MKELAITLIINFIYDNGYHLLYSKFYEVQDNVLTNFTTYIKYTCPYKTVNTVTSLAQFNRTGNQCPDPRLT